MAAMLIIRRSGLVTVILASHLWTSQGWNKEMEFCRCLLWLMQTKHEQVARMLWY